MVVVTMWLITINYSTFNLVYYGTVPHTSTAPVLHRYGSGTLTRYTAQRRYIFRLFLFQKNKIARAADEDYR